MKNLDLLDKRIIERSGAFAPLGYTINGEDFSPSFIKQRVKELGFVGEYRWGVEYKTDGKRPELDGDVEVDVKGEAQFWMCNTAGHVWWAHSSTFKITDQRYKPADTSYLNNEAEMLIQNKADWYDYDNQKALRLPPVGAECEYEDSPEVKNYSKCTILAVLNDAFAFSRPDYKNTIFTGNLRTHVVRPLDHDRKAKAERKRVVDAAFASLSEFRTASQTLEELYDKGFLRMPD